MKISNGSIWEFLLGIFFLSVGFNINNFHTAVITILISITVIVHCLYLWIKQKKKILDNDNSRNIKKNSTNHIKKLKPKKSFLVILSIIIILNVLLFSYSIFLLNSNKKLKKEKKELNINQKKNEKKDNIEFEIDSNNNDKTCTYYPMDGTYYITISAESSGGVGDVFSKMDSNLEYRIYDNAYGETYISKRKYQGDSNIYECNETWYEVYLQNGKHGFIYSGYNGMGVKEK